MVERSEKCSYWQAEEDLAEDSLLTVRHEEEERFIFSNNNYISTHIK